ncbi:hypothetical protein KR018_001626 [Drosophila ironensis]|nr:hypothetical protein KR018_001626 [Drosophila ironensis]
MFDWVGLLLRTFYYYGLLIGVSNFEIDWKTSRVFKTTRSTSYAALFNILVVILIVAYWCKRFRLHVIFGNVSKLHEYVMVLMSILRFVAGLASLLNRWRQRCRLMHLTRSLFRLYNAKPQVIRMSRWPILIKAFSVLMADVLAAVLALENIDRLGYTQILGILLQFFLMAVMSYVIAQYYLIMLFIRVQYQMLNSELRQVIRESRWLSYHSPRNGVFMTRCCFLADKLDDLARQLNSIQTLIDNVSEVFAVQGLLVYAAYYISSLTSTFMAYSVLKHGYKYLNISLTATIVYTAWCSVYFLDAIRNLFLVLSIQDNHRVLVRLLEERTVFAPGLDVRLEETFENFQFQLARNPLKMTVMNIFPLNHKSTTAMFGSLLMNSIYLIQYEMQNFYLPM